MDLVCGHLEYKDLINYTDNFSKENYVGNFQFGKVYRGKIKESTHELQHVLVKIWIKSKLYNWNEGDNIARLMQEIMLLRHEKLKSHPGSIELYGYCWDNDHLGIVYNINPLDTLHNLATKDSFTWLQRIKVAVKFARLLQFLHTGDPTFKPMLIRNIAAAHIVLDEEYNPRLFDFGMVSGGIFPDRTIYRCYYLPGCFGYYDRPALHGKWSEGTDVFAFGVLLLILITKRVVLEERRDDIDSWAHHNYKGSDKTIHAEKIRYSLVDQSLEKDPDFSFGDGRKITKLAMSCIHWEPELRPSMKHVVKNLQKLQTVKKHTNFIN